MLCVIHHDSLSRRLGVYAYHLNVELDGRCAVIMSSPIARMEVQYRKSAKRSVRKPCTSVNGNLSTNFFNREEINNRRIDEDLYT